MVAPSPAHCLHQKVTNKMIETIYYENISTLEANSKII